MKLVIFGLTISSSWGNGHAFSSPARDREATALLSSRRSADPWFTIHAASNAHRLARLAGGAGTP